MHANVEVDRKHDHLNDGHDHQLQRVETAKHRAEADQNLHRLLGELLSKLSTCINQAYRCRRNIALHDV
jgi:hypothetical protein